MTDVCVSRDFGSACVIRAELTLTGPGDRDSRLALAIQNLSSVDMRVHVRDGHGSQTCFDSIEQVELTIGSDIEMGLFEEVLAWALENKRNLTRAIMTGRVQEYMRCEREGHRPPVRPAHPPQAAAGLHTRPTGIVGPQLLLDAG
jgi:hypothetical protein